MSVVTWEKNGSAAVVHMCNGANRMNLEFVRQMDVCFKEAMADQEVRSMVIASTDEKNFSQGIDLEWVMAQMQDNRETDVQAFLLGMNEIFKQVLLMPVPVVAAIGGHAFGDGAMLACCCDFRFMKKHRGFFCFPEVDINIPFLPGMIKFVRKAIPEPQFNRMILSGCRCGAEELEAAKVVEKACEDDDALMAEAIAFAQGFEKQRGIFGVLKQRMHQHIADTMDTEDIEIIKNTKLGS